MNEPTVIAIPFFVLTLVIEAYVLYRQGKAYEPWDTAASISGGLGSLVTKALFKGATFAVYSWLWEFRLFEPGTGVLAWVLLVPLEDLCYYAYHRTSHEVRFFWAAHVAHHSSERYTLATALRQSWTAPVVQIGFWFPLPLLGFRPEMILLMQSFSLLYQYWIHTETIDRLGPLEWVMNTPSHHRVHHGSNPQYLDRNHAGIFIIWDRLFSTFEPEGETVRYGITKPLGTTHWLVVQFHEFRDIWRDLRAYHSLRARLRAVFGRPGEVLSDASEREQRAH